MGEPFANLTPYFTRECSKYFIEVDNFDECFDFTSLKYPVYSRFIELLNPTSLTPFMKTSKSNYFKVIDFRGLYCDCLQILFKGTDFEYIYVSGRMDENQKIKFEVFHLSDAEKFLKYMGPFPKLTIGSFAVSITTYVKKYKILEFFFDDFTAGELLPKLEIAVLPGLEVVGVYRKYPMPHTLRKIHPWSSAEILAFFAVFDNCKKLRRFIFRFNSAGWRIYDSMANWKQPAEAFYQQHRLDYCHLDLNGYQFYVEHNILKSLMPDGTLTSNYDRHNVMHPHFQHPFASH